jgi:hypothetical protein
MPNSPKPDLYTLRKALEEPLTTTYGLYTVEDLRSELEAAGVDIERSLAELAETQAVEEEKARLEPPTPPRGRGRPRKNPLPTEADPDEMPGQRLNTHAWDEPIRVDENGVTWYQEEVRKPAYPKPRGRRVLKYLETGVRTETVQSGEYVETFEVAGVGESRPAEVKITLPSYQVGIYKDPRFPFRIHCYDGRQGFDLFEVQQYYGGSELVPPAVKRVYIENDLCYDIRSVIQAIQAEHRELQLSGRLK